MNKNRRLLALSIALAALPTQAFELLPMASMDDNHVFKLEVLQVTDIEPYQEALNGFLDTLKSQGIEQGKNLKVNRVRIDFDVENGGFWSRLGVLFRIRQEAARIAATKPDLALTIGTPATRHARGILEDARVPVVFTAVADPLEAGCVSLNDGGPGVTGSTLYVDMRDSVRMVQQVFPAVKKIGMIHTDDENGVANVAAASSSASQIGMSVTARQVGKSDSIVPSLKAMFQDGKGVQMFAVPLDTYYGLHRYEPAIDLGEFGAAHQIPVVTLAMVHVPGAVMYVGADFRQVGSLAGVQAGKILRNRTKPDVLPILRQKTPTMLIDPERAAALKLDLPSAILAHKTATRNGFWMVDWEQVRPQ
ncbi:ABC transporter substrate-binding protein [Massilia sp. BJB1822]|uniref:ABC transporter substrate-binding protein n=1 Tax=Massilia sp. BJB1822 TaxID=2744470 RepID=UPI001593E253|nr:ABC transporter substrate-binding protein [Massilia sp. BJB1822]NVE00204.1 ABC transporter substrate-binding protein [Massilia sp. BJB1822]